MKGGGSHFKRVVGFALVPAATMISTLLVLPLISRQFGPDGWSAVGIGQSIGAFISIVAGLGWQVVGAQQVAESGRRRRRIIFAESLKSRTLVLFVLLGPAALFCYALSPAFKMEAILFATAMGLNCLNASWFFAGTGESKYVFYNEGLVRLVGYVASVPVLALTQSLVIYASILMFTGFVSAFLNFRVILRPLNKRDWVSARSPALIIKEHLTGALSRMLTAAQLHVGPAIVAIAHPQSLHVFTALYNVHKAVNNASATYPQAFAWWVGSPINLKERARRTNLLALVTIGIGIIISLGWSFLGLPIMSWLYNDSVEVPLALNIVCAISMGTFAASRAAGLLGLIPLGMQSTVYLSSSVAATICIVGMVLGAATAGSFGAFSVMALTSLTLTAYLMAVRYSRAKRILDTET